MITFIKRKQDLRIVLTLLSFPFLIFILSAFQLCGTPFNNAEAKYELYEAGHHYLKNHNIYAEVAKDQYVYMKIIQIIGIASFFADCFLRITFQNKFKKKITV